MQNIKNFIEESKSNNINTNISVDDFSNDLYNVLTDLMFEYNQAGKNISKSDFEKEIKNFTNKFFE